MEPKAGPSAANDFWVSAYFRTALLGSRCLRRKNFSSRGAPNANFERIKSAFSTSQSRGFVKIVTDSRRFSQTKLHLLGGKGVAFWLETYRIFSGAFSAVRAELSKVFSLICSPRPHQTWLWQLLSFIVDVFLCRGLIPRYRSYFFISDDLCGAELQWT